MNKTVAATLIVFSLLIFGCGNNSEEKNKEQVNMTTHKEHQHDAKFESIEFNDGDKWKVVSEMLLIIRNMENDVNRFVFAEQKNYKSIAQKLQTNIDLLTSSCTMEGKAHEELHKWLLPYMDLVKELASAQDDAESTKHFEQIRESFSTFNKYFQ